MGGGGTLWWCWHRDTPPGTTTDANVLLAPLYHYWRHCTPLAYTGPTPGQHRPTLVNTGNLENTKIINFSENHEIYQKSSISQKIMKFIIKSWNGPVIDTVNDTVSGTVNTASPWFKRVLRSLDISDKTVTFRHIWDISDKLWHFWHIWDISDTFEINGSLLAVFLSVLTSSCL